MEIRGLLFDGDDVLYDATVWRRWLLRLLGRLGLHTHYDAFYRVWEREYLDEVNQGQRDYWDALRCFLRSSGLKHGQVDEVVAASHGRYRQLQETARALPGVVATIARLSGLGIPMAVLNNSHWPADHTHRLLDRLGLGDRFDAVLTSRDLGCTKPSAASYQAALGEMQLPAPHVAFVGHDGVELAGADRVGMRTIAINYTHDAEADIHLDKFDELLSHISFRASRRLAG